MATIAEIRSQYPQYADMPDAALADALYKKFYTDIPRNAFDVKVGLKPAAGENRRQMIEAEASKIPFGETALSLGAGFSKGVGNVMFGGQRLVGKGLKALGATETGEALSADAERRIAAEQAKIQQYKDVAPIATGAGEIAGEVISTLPVGGVLAKGVTKVAPGATRLAESIRTGGFSTGAPAATTFGGRVVNAGTRAAGGAILGGATAALTNPEEAETGAVIGAAAPFVLPTVGRYIAIGGGKIIDGVTGKLAEVKAGKVAREMAGDAVNTIRAANNLAPMNTNAAQAVSGLDNDVYQAFLDFYAGKDKTAFQRVLKDNQKLGQLNQLARLAGGSTDTEIITNIDSAKRVLNNLTTPMRQDVFETVTKTTQKMPALAQESKVLRKEAADKVADVRRFADAQRRAITPAEDNLATDYLLGKLAGSADEVAGKAAVESLTAGAGARTAEAKLADMQSQGLKPLSGATIAAQIDRLASQKGVRADDVQSKALLNLRDKLIDLSAPSKGLLDVEDIYQVRKTAINDAITKALSESGYDPKAQSARLAGLLGDVRTMIDDAIRAAGGGDDWNKYLETFSKGREQLNQRVASGQLLKILDKDPKKFVDIVKGNDPEFVEKLFGAGNKDIIQAMGGQRPNSPMVKLFGLADEVERDLGIKTQVKAGRKALNLEDQYGNPTEVIPGFVGYKTAIAKTVARTLAGKVNDKAQRLITDAVRSGESMNKILNTLPAEERLKVIDLFKNNPELKRLITPGVISTTTPSANVLSDQQNQNALAR
jgi:hypothetical protein